MGMGKSAVFDIYKKNMRNFAGFLAFLFLGNLGFIVLGGERVSALYVPTLSASVDKADVSLNGRDFLQYSANIRTFDIRYTTNSNLKNGFTASLSTESDETALINDEVGSTTKIKSIDNTKSLYELEQNSWGIRMPNSSKYDPIPSASSARVFTENNWQYELSIGIRVGDNLESGRYSNKLIFSMISNPYELIAETTSGYKFNDIMKSFDTIEEGYYAKKGENIEHIKRSNVLPSALANVKNLESNYSDYEIKTWYDESSKTIYYYCEKENIFLNSDSNGMFSGFKNLINIDLEYFDTSRTTDMTRRFSNLSKIERINLSKFNTEKVTSMDGMFSNLKNLVELDLKTFKTSNVLYMGDMFYGVEKLVNLDLSMFDTKKVLSMQHMFHDMKNIENLDVSSFNTSKVINMTCMFSDMEKMKNLNLFNFDTSSVKEMTLMFYGSKSLQGLNITSFNTENVVDARGMFQDLKNIRQIDVSNFDTRKMTTMNSMFSGMEKLETLNVSNFDTSNVIDMGSMFAGLKTLAYLDLSNFDTRNVKYMSSVFEHMENIENLNLPNFSTDNVTTMSSMFKEMYKLKRLDISNFKTPKLTSAYRMFACEYGTGSLETIYVNEDFNIDSITDDDMLFYRQDKLRGGNGSFATNNYTAGKEWLKVDRPGVQGYFTRKT